MKIILRTPNGDYNTRLEGEYTSPPAVLIVQQSTLYSDRPMIVDKAYYLLFKEGENGEPSIYRKTTPIFTSVTPVVY